MKYLKFITLLLIVQSFLLISCKKEESPPVVPKVLFSNLTLKEGNSGEKIAVINVDLSEATSVPVSFKWHTEEGSAKAGSDYIAVSDGTLSFDAGDVSRVIEVHIVSDDILEFDENFHILITDLVNATATDLGLMITIENDDTYKPELTAEGYITPASYPGMELVWSDEFDGTALNTADWNYELGGGGWGNNELEVYTNSTQNSSVQNGFLTITALKNPYNSQYTSARLTTKGKQEFKYGRIDIRAKMPKGQGIWPALWMLGGNISSVGWPSCGEIDIMEYLGHDPLTVYGTVHYNNGGHQYKGSRYIVESDMDYSKKFHVFTLIWQENYMEWFVDYKNYFSATPSTISYTAFTLPQFFIFNVAVGGNWPGSPNSTTTFPQSMVIDYVRIFQ